MDSYTLTIKDIAGFLEEELAVHRYPTNEQGGVYHPSEQPVRRIGLALEPFVNLATWAIEQDLDALWIHRPWQLDLSHLPADVGVLSHHLPFDETLTIGYNKRLSHQLGAQGEPEPLGFKQEPGKESQPSLQRPLGHRPVGQRPLGMLIDVAEQEFDYRLAQIKQLFGGYDRAEAGRGSSGWQPINSRIAVVGAMTDALIREAAERGAHVYLTGAYRKPAQQAVDETGMAVISIGHRRCEEWGLLALANLLSEHLPLECVIHQQPQVFRS